MIEQTTVFCPYCGEQFETVVDYSSGSQQYTEDCFVCCQPIIFFIDVGMDGKIENIRTIREDDC